MQIPCSIHITNEECSGLYPINWKITNRPCLVVGGGRIACRKSAGLLQAGAAVTVIAPEAEPPVHEWAGQGKIQWIQRSYNKGDAGHFDLVVSACGNRGTALQIAQDTEGKNILWNAADYPEMGSCTLPARFCRGSLMITVSTEGHSPALSREICRRLEEEIPPLYGEWLDRLSSLRQEMKTAVKNPADREKFWHQAFSRDISALVNAGNLKEADARIRYAISRFRSKS